MFVFENNKKFKWLSIVAIICLVVFIFDYSISASNPSVILFSHNVKVDLIDLNTDLFVIAGSECDAIDFNNDYSEVTMNVNVDEVLKVGSSDNKYLEFSPRTGAADLIIDNNSLDSSGYINSWQEVVAAATTINVHLSVPQTNTNYVVKKNNSRMLTLNSGDNAFISFNHALSSGIYSFTIEQSSGGSGSTPEWILKEESAQLHGEENTEDSNLPEADDSEEQQNDVYINNGPEQEQKQPKEESENEDIEEDDVVSEDEELEGVEGDSFTSWY